MTEGYGRCVHVRACLDLRLGESRGRGPGPNKPPATGVSRGVASPAVSGQCQRSGQCRGGEATGPEGKTSSSVEGRAGGEPPPPHGQRCCQEGRQCVEREGEGRALPAPQLPCHPVQAGAPPDAGGGGAAGRHARTQGEREPLCSKGQRSTAAEGRSGQCKSVYRLMLVGRIGKAHRRGPRGPHPARAGRRRSAAQRRARVDGVVVACQKAAMGGFGRHSEEGARWACGAGAGESDRRQQPPARGVAGHDIGCRAQPWVWAPRPATLEIRLTERGCARLGLGFGAEYLGSAAGGRDCWC